MLPLVLFALAGCAGPEPTDAPPASEAWEGPKRINGTDLHVKIVGTGEPVLVLHGGPGWDHSIFLPHLESLGSDFRLIFFDQRASGRSAIENVDPADMSVEQFLEDIDALRVEFGLDRITLMGHSFGGRLALQYAVAHPDRVRALILVSPTAASDEYAEQVSRILRERLTPEQRAERDRLLAAGAPSGEPPEAYVRLMHVLLSANFHDRNAVESLNVYVPDRFAERQERFQALLSTAFPYDFHAELPRIDAPTLVLRGDVEALPLEATLKIHEGIESSRFSVLENCGHFVFAECNEAFVKAVRDFGHAVLH